MACPRLYNPFSPESYFWTEQAGQAGQAEQAEQSKQVKCEYSWCLCYRSYDLNLVKQNKQKNASKSNVSIRDVSTIITTTWYGLQSEDSDGQSGDDSDTWGSSDLDDDGQDDESDDDRMLRKVAMFPDNELLI